MTKPLIQAVIFEKLDKLRTEFDTIVYPDYYRLVPEPKLLESYFIHNRVLGHDMEIHQREYDKAISLDKEFRLLEAELIRHNPKLIHTVSDLDSLFLVVNDLTSIMVLTPEMFAQLKQAFDQAAQSMRNRKPILYIELDLIDEVCRIFWPTIRQLKQLLDHQPTQLKAMYATCQIRNLEYLELSVQKKWQALSICITTLKKVFKSELQNKVLQDKCGQFPIEYFFEKQTRGPVIKALSFGLKKLPGFLIPIIEGLNLKIGFLDPRTSIDDFMRIVSSDDLGSITGKIYLGCKTNEFKYIIHCLNPFFKSFKPATIGKSGIFISNTGHPITAGCIYSCNSDNLQTKLGIDNVFNQMR